MSDDVLGNAPTLVTAQVLLKARPTATQLADRLRAPRPDGLELYLDLADLASVEAMDGVVARIEACELPDDFTLLVEGPIRSLDGEFFDLSRDSDADRELSRRIVDLSRRIGALGANIHAIAPSADPGALTAENRAAILDRAIGPARVFADLAHDAAVVPTVENIPPILRMRESGFYYSAIGMPPSDLAELVAHVAGLQVVFDTSHAQLYLNARRGVEEAVPDLDVESLRRFAADPDGPDTLDEYLDMLPATFWCQVSNAAGLLGEGLPYGEGDINLDALIPRLVERARYIVIETLEPDHEHAVHMRDAQARMLRVLDRVATDDADGLA